MEENNVSETKESNGNNIFKKKEILVPGIIGAIIGGILVYLLVVSGVIGIKNETFVTFNGGQVSSNEVYSDMKKQYPVSYLLEHVDKAILDSKYTLTDEQKDEVNKQAESVLNMYQVYYGYTEEKFLSDNGFENKDKFVEYLELDYKRNLYCIDYYKTLLPQEKIQEYYDNNIYGEVSTKHILVEAKDEAAKASALATAKEIIEKLNAGSSFDDVAKEYEDKTKSENVNFDSFSAKNYEEAYIKASLALEVGNYTKEVVETSYGYHVIYIADKKDKPELSDVENDIVEALSADLEKEDTYIRYKALIKMREDNNINFVDETYKKAYEDYCQEINGEG